MVGIEEDEELEEMVMDDELEEEPLAVAMIYPTPLTWLLEESMGMTMFELSFSCLPAAVSVMVKLEVQSPDSMK